MQVHVATDTCTSPNGQAFATTRPHLWHDNYNPREEVAGFQSLRGSSHRGKFLAAILT